jgi:hypothetical protein
MSPAAQRAFVQQPVRKFGQLAAIGRRAGHVGTQATFRRETAGPSPTAQGNTAAPLPSDVDGPGAGGSRAEWTRGPTTSAQLIPVRDPACPRHLRNVRAPAARSAPSPPRRNGGGQCEIAGGRRGLGPYRTGPTGECLAATPGSRSGLARRQRPTRASSLAGRRRTRPS